MTRALMQSILILVILLLDTIYNGLEWLYWHSIGGRVQSLQLGWDYSRNYGFWDRVKFLWGVVR